VTGHHHCGTQSVDGSARHATLWVRHQPWRRSGIPRQRYVASAIRCSRCGCRASANIRELLAAPDWSHRPDAAGRLINGWILDVPAAEDYLKQLPGDRDALLCLYAQQWPLPKRPEMEFLNIVHALSWRVVAKPDVSAQLADLAANRVEWVLGHVNQSDEDMKPRPSDVRHTLAVVRLRQGQPGDDRRLCADALDPTAELVPEAVSMSAT
jgi:hypothetical protein